MIKTYIPSSKPTRHVSGGQAIWNAHQSWAYPHNEGRSKMSNAQTISSSTTPLFQIENIDKRLRRSRNVCFAHRTNQSIPVGKRPGRSETHTSIVQCRMRAFGASTLSQSSSASSPMPAIPATFRTISPHYSLDTPSRLGLVSPFHHLPPYIPCKAVPYTALS
jgi:hypothetical protein